MTTATATRATTSADTVAIGERLGFYSAMADTPVTAVELASRTNAPVGFVHEWLSEQARRGYLTRDPASGRYATYCDWPRAN